MKLQILELNQTKRGRWFHFLTSLTQKKNYARDSRCNPQTTVSFLNELDTEMGTMLITSVSFFNKVSIENKNYPRN
jgi:hypothetical protein